VLVEVGVGVALAVICVAIRYLLVPVMHGIAPYALVFAAVSIAAVVAGWRAGVVALVIGQFLALVVIVEPNIDVVITDVDRAAGFIVASLSQAILLATIGLYQREVDKGTAEREQQLALLDEALREIDHRTRNNYQTVLALIDLQARRTKNEQVGSALRQVAERIQAIATASQQLAVRSADLGAIRLDDHLCGLVEQIGRGLSRDEINVECDVDHVTASVDKATSISIIVNELVTNAIKHAFNGASAGRVRVSGKSANGFELVVADDGAGIQGRRGAGSGLGSKLVESFARQLGARHEVVSSSTGTTHRLLIPTLD
jgi:two-component sensor histidine kinase